MSEYDGLSIENAVLGAILIDPGTLTKFCSDFKPDDFHLPIAKDIFAQLQKMQTTGSSIDPVTLYSYFEQKDSDRSIHSYIMQLLECTPTAANADVYVALLKQRNLKESVMEASEALTASLAAGDDPVTAAASAMEALEKAQKGPQPLVYAPADSIAAFCRHQSEVQSGKKFSVPSGIPELDELLGGGFIPGGMYIMAARPGVGKTILGLEIADDMAKRGPVLYVSLEMSITQLQARRAANISGMSALRCMNIKLDDTEKRRLATAIRRMSERKLYFNSKAEATVSEVMAMARSCKPDAIVIDYLGLLSVSQDFRGSQYEKITLISRQLKELAISLNTPIICLAQLNRASESRTDKHPAMSDLRDSGAIEQDADAVFLLHRPAMYQDKKPKPYEGQEFEINLAKNRHGQCDALCLTWYASSGRLQSKSWHSWD